MKITFSIVFILATLTSCNLLGSNGDDKPDIPGKIVFAAEDNGGTSQIYRMNTNGSRLRQLTSFPASGEAVQPSWSPDGQQIIFSSFQQGTSIGPALWIMDADGGNQRVLYDPEPDNPHAPPLAGRNVRWSPEGSNIVYDLCINCQIGTNYELFIYEVATDAVTRLTDNRTNETNPAWSPDSSRIAFVSDRDYVDADTLQFRQDLYLMDNDGSNVQRLTETGFARNPIWNPNGNAITFRSSDPETNLGLFRVALQNKQISRIENNLSGNSQLFPQSWSADGKFLLATGRDQSAPQEFFLYIIDTVNNKTIQLPFGPTRISGVDWFIPADN